jgi:hypothetical protein
MGHGWPGRGWGNHQIAGPRPLRTTKGCASGWRRNQGRQSLVAGPVAPWHRAIVVAAVVLAAGVEPYMWALRHGVRRGIPAWAWPSSPPGRARPGLPWGRGHSGGVGCLLLLWAMGTALQCHGQWAPPPTTMDLKRRSSINVMDIYNLEIMAPIFGSWHMIFHVINLNFLHYWWDDDLVQKNLLPLMAIHASEALEMEHKSLVFDLFGYKVCMKFCSLLW